MSKLDEMLADAEKEKESILAELAPLRAEEAKLMKQFAPLDAKLREVREKCAKIEKDRDLADVSRTIVALGKSKRGDKTLKAEPGTFKKPV